jgi:hypothetical protein
MTVCPLRDTISLLMFWQYCSLRRSQLVLHMWTGGARRWCRRWHHWCFSSKPYIINFQRIIDRPHGKAGACWVLIISTLDYSSEGVFWLSPQIEAWWIGSFLAWRLSFRYRKWLQLPTLDAFRWFKWHISVALWAPVWRETTFTCCYNRCVSAYACNACISLRLTVTESSYFDITHFATGQQSITT